eukprot:5435-Rhodomonas_salina.4
MPTPLYCLSGPHRSTRCTRSVPRILPYCAKPVLGSYQLRNVSTASVYLLRQYRVGSGSASAGTSSYGRLRQRRRSYRLLAAHRCIR